MKIFSQTNETHFNWKCADLSLMISFEARFWIPGELTLNSYNLLNYSWIERHLFRNSKYSLKPHLKWMIHPFALKVPHFFEIIFSFWWMRDKLKYLSWRWWQILLPSTGLTNRFLTYFFTVFGISTFLFPLMKNNMLEIYSP